MTATLPYWVPTSPCGDGCLPADAPRVSSITVMARGVMVGAALVTAPVLSAGWLFPRAWRTEMQRGYSRALLRCLGMKLTVDDQRLGRAEPAGVMVVAGHVSWTDVLVASAVAPANFVARADLLDWAVLGGLARRMRVVPIDRARLRELPGTVDVVRERLQRGVRVMVFPEGTTWCGRAYGGFRPAMFQAAVDAECPVQPMAIRYENADGSLCTGPCFVGTETIGQSIRRILRQKNVEVKVRLAPLEEAGECRIDLAQRCERAVRGVETIDLAAHDIFDPAPELVTQAVGQIDPSPAMTA
ncbi:lysophospholipid acyltransferase family protein [Rhodococcus baikonurensis]|uniref:lysophospholipid acyltransferase family protein n=1 Tax=Rhodococcus baikonurensis TaxID=172041 RepID=UPI0037BD3C57